MSQGMNKVMLLGNLGADPELRYTAKGQPVLSISLATNESWVDKNTKEVQERVEWHRVTVWGNRGEALSRFLSKGDCVVVDGHLETHSYEKDGVKHYRTEVVARDVFLTGRRPMATPSAEVSAPRARTTEQNGAAPRPEPELAEDIAF